jgi:hypothetical protein
LAPWHEICDASRIVPRFISAQGEGTAMRICLACYGHRVATLLESATELRFACGGPAGAPETARLPVPVRKLGLPKLLDMLAAANVDLLICGAVSRREHEFLRSRHLQVEAWIGGFDRDVIQAWRQGQIATKRLPGCPATRTPRRA